MTKIFTKVKSGDLITSALFNQITDKIEEIDEITSVMEIKKNSVDDASKPGNLTIKSNLGVGTKEPPSEKLEVNGTVKAGNDGQFLLLNGVKSSESTMSLDFVTSNEGRGSSSIPTASFRAIDDKYFSSHLGFFTKETSPDQNNLTERLRITSNGNVGIGTSTPSSKLEVNGIVTASRFVGDGSGLTGITGGKAGQWTDIEGGIYYDKGKVGIGTINPSVMLEVNGNIKAKSIESKPAVYDFKVEGKLEEFYPIVFKDDNWGDGPLVLEINRPNVDTDSDKRGSLISKFTVHSTNGNHGADICHAEIHNNQDINTEFIAGYENIPESADFVVWLRGGKTTYSYMSNHFVTLNSSANTKLVNDKPYELKKSVESYVVKNGIHFDKGLVIDGNVGIGITAPSEKLEVKGTVKADKFLGDGSGLTGVKTGKWTDVAGGRISYNSGNVGIGTTDPQAKLTVCGDPSTVNIETAEIIRLWRYGVGGVKNTNTASLYLGSFEKGISGRARLDFYLSGIPSNENLYGSFADVNVMSLLGNGNVGIGTTNPSSTLDVNGDVTIKGNLGTHGYSPIAFHNGWNGGIHTFDIEAEGSIWCKNNVYSGTGVFSKLGDLAENYQADIDLEAGDVVCLDEDEDRIVLSEKPNDSLVVGVISTKPGFLLNWKRDDNRIKLFPVALCGRVPCKVVDENGPINRGDLLTSSSTPGHAMKANPIKDREFFIPGTIIGKALGTLESGKDIIDIFVFLS